MNKRAETLLGALLLSLILTGGAQAAPAEPSALQAEAEDFSYADRLQDGSRYSYAVGGQKPTVTLRSPEGIGSLYLEFDTASAPWTLEAPELGEEIACGQNGFLHEFVDVEQLFGGLPRELKLHFAPETAMGELYAFPHGETPDWVQRWQPPCEQTDLMVFSTHADDEQLFFAGVLPYYAIEKGLDVQVSYTVQHFGDHYRGHEQLDGLWTVGVRHYPLMSDFPDLYAQSKNRAEALAQAEAVYSAAGVSYDDFVAYMTECLRRCHPLVVLTHDLSGEYGHGGHATTAKSLTEALDCSADPDRCPDSAEQYGLWQVQKAYVHLYPENPVVLDFMDQPLDSMGGKTPFQVSQDGFGCHKSQHWTWFYDWMYGKNGTVITRADQIRNYNPAHYGLYMTQVGPDVTGGDLFENVKTYGQQRQEAREQARLEEERRQAEEEARKKAEAQARAEAEAEAAARAAREKKQRAVLTSVCVAAAVAVGIGVWIRRRRK